MALKTLACDTIPISSLLTSEIEPSPSTSDSPLESSGHPTCHSNSAEMSSEHDLPQVSTARDTSLSSNHALDSDTIVVKPAPSSSTSRPRKRTYEPKKAGADASRARKRPRRTQSNRGQVLQESLTPPATSIPVPPLSESAQAHVNGLPPTSIVTKCNRTTHEFRNGLTSVRVPQEHEQTREQPTDAAGGVRPSTHNDGDVPQNPMTPTNVATASVAQRDIDSNASQQGHLYGCGQPAVNWDSHTHVIQDQKIYTTYEKPSKCSSNPSSGNINIPNQAYNKMTTKTITITITTTIATTEIVRPGEPGYKEALERHRRQSALSAEGKEQLRRGYLDSKVWTTPDGARRLNEERHWPLHKGADARARSQVTTVSAPPSDGADSTDGRTVTGTSLTGKTGEEGVPAEVQIKFEVPANTTMDQVQEFVRVKVEDIGL